MKRIIFAALLMLSLSGCSHASQSVPEPTAVPEPPAIVTEAVTEMLTDPPTEPSSEPPTEPTAECEPETTETSEAETLPEPSVPSAEGFSLAQVPAYSGIPYAEINGNTPFFTEHPTEVFELYSPLDELGRCGTAYANICEELMPTEERGEIGMIRPSGWHTANYSGILEDTYLYNRCHLIGFQLAGENDNERNLITGTRYMNVEGMEPFECKVAGFVKSYHAHVLYRVTPVFAGEELVARGVLMEAYAADGPGLSFCVFCYNVQPGIEIEYATGESRSLIVPTETLPPETAPAETETRHKPETSESVTPVFSEDVTYVFNTKSMKFHYPSCLSVPDIAEYNRYAFTGTREEAIKAGYQPCKRCNP